MVSQDILMLLSMTEPTKWPSGKDSDQPVRLFSLIRVFDAPEDYLGPKLPIKRAAKTDHTGRMPGWFESSLGVQIIVLVLWAPALVLNCRICHFT